MRRSAVSGLGIGVVVATLLALLGASPVLLPAVAQDEPASAELDPGESSEAAIGKRLETVEAEIEERRQRLSDTGPESEAMREEIAALERLRTTLAEELRVARLPEAGEDVGEKAEPRASIVLLGSLNEAQQRNELRIGSLRDALEASETAVTAAKRDLEEKERQRRQAKERDVPVGEVERRLRDIDLRQAREAVRVREIKRRNARAAVEAQKARGEELARLIQETERLIRDDPDAAADLSELDERERALARQEMTLERELEAAELKHSQAKSRYASETNPPSILFEQVEGLALQREILEQRLAAARHEAGRIATRRSLLERWRRVLQGAASRDEMGEWEEELEQMASEDRLGLTERQGRLEEVRSRIDSLRTRLSSTPESDGIREPLGEQIALLGSLQEVLEGEMARLQAGAHLRAGLMATIRERLGRVSPREQLGRLAAGIRDTWRYEVVVIDDEGIAIGEIVIALLLLSLGFALSRRLSRGISGALRTRARLDSGAAAAIETVTFYAFLVGFALFALRTVNFPLTAFTLLGGALAIGVGFGSQNVMNNFISGLILLLERPVRAGDLVEIDGTHGTVERIGARSTTIRATRNTHIVVPNSFFLENSVVNWTLSDDIIRSKVNVGVVYGAPTREVERILLQVMHEEARVLSEPAPIVVFADFGDNSLNFEAYYWTRARSPMALRRVESSIRFRIDDLFREAGIVIAFPQRDVHLDGVGPLDVRLLSEERVESDAARRGERERGAHE